MPTIVKICVPKTSRDFFDYYTNDKLPEIGVRVWVPFRNQTRLGIMLGSENAEIPNPKIKSIVSILDEKPVLSLEMLALCQWMSKYYQSPLSEVIPLALPKKYRNGDDCQLPVCEYYYLNVTLEEAHHRLAAKARRQHALVDFFHSQQQPLSKKMLAVAGFKSSQLQALLNLSMLAIQEQTETPLPRSGLKSEPLILNEQQAMAFISISNQLHTYGCFLLQGVTGSGKTEVYLHLIERVLAAGRQVLVMVPEIGLTPQLLARFRARFHEPMAVIHSHLNDTERLRAWQMASADTVKLVIGTRAAIFTPLPSLGLIIIDEEHDASLKQMEGVRYSARDTALMRAHMANIPIILGSATPSLESLHNCVLKKYTLLNLTEKALTRTPLHYHIVDIRNQILQQGLARDTLTRIREHLEQQQQVLVFINRRGFAPVLLCHQCGWMADCQACESHLTLHRLAGKLICHHCGRTQTIPTHCLSCKSNELLPVGAGTQRIHEFLSSYFPTTSIVRIDRDEVRVKRALDERLERINSGDAQLIIGTQMLAKGHHFPRLTLVVVLDADNGFYNQDFRALERLGQLLTQVAGRAGRAHLPGQVMIQTHLPQHPLLNLLIQQGYESFAHSLLTMRLEAELPPFHFLAVIRAQGKILSNVLHFLHIVKEQLNLNLNAITTMGPAPAPLARKANFHRLQLLLKSRSRSQLQTALTQLRRWLTQHNPHSNVRWNIDVDPVDLS